MAKLINSVATVIIIIVVVVVNDDDDDGDYDDMGAEPRLSIKATDCKQSEPVVSEWEVWTFVVRARKVVVAPLRMGPGLFYTQAFYNHLALEPV